VRKNRPVGFANHDFYTPTADIITCTKTETGSKRRKERKITLKLLGVMELRIYFIGCEACVKRGERERERKKVK